MKKDFIKTLVLAIVALVLLCVARAEARTYFSISIGPPYVHLPCHPHICRPCPPPPPCYYRHGYHRHLHHRHIAPPPRIRHHAPRHRHPAVRYNPPPRPHRAHKR